MNFRNTLLPLVLVLLLTGCSSGITGSGTPTPAPTAADLTPAHLENTSLPTAVAEDEFTRLREAMVAETIESRGVKDPAVLAAMLHVPRHEFVPDDYLDQAYADHPLPIGYGQTISQPYIVAWMTELLELQPGDRVLEIGTGSGYQAAVLAELEGLDVYSIEIVPQLAEAAAQRLEALGYSEVKVKQGDGYYGWPEAAPFDAIIVTAAPDHLPAPLAGQLSGDGRIVIPIGPPGLGQSLWKFGMAGGELKGYNLGMVSFVPFTGEGIQTGGTPTP